MIPTNLDPFDYEEQQRQQAELELAEQRRERFEEAPQAVLEEELDKAKTEIEWLLVRNHNLHIAFIEMQERVIQRDLEIERLQAECDGLRTARQDRLEATYKQIERLRQCVVTANASNAATYEAGQKEVQRLRKRLTEIDDILNDVRLGDGAKKVLLKDLLLKELAPTTAAGGEA